MSLADKLARVWDGTSATATDATGATERPISLVSVANVAPVAVATPKALCGTNPELPVSTEAIAEAKRHIARARLTPEARQARLADLERTPVLARFWILVWDTKAVDLPNNFGKIEGE